MSAVRKIQSPSKKDKRSMQPLLKQLMKVWSSKEVEENYQNYYLTYLDSLPDHLVEIEISRQIKKTLQNKSHYFNINKSLALHSTSIAKLKLAVDKIEKQDKISENDLEYICELIDELRNNNMLVAQNTLNFNYQSSSKSNNQFGFVHGNNYIFEKINSDHAFLKASFLRKYIVFTNSYDPFFLYHYETAKTTNDRKYKSHPSIQKLFSLSISKAYKIMKIQQDILEFLSGKIPVDREMPKKRLKRYNYSLINDRNLYKTAIEQTDAENLATNRLENLPYMKANQQFRQDNQQKNLRKRAYTEQNTVSRYFQTGIGGQRQFQQSGQQFLPKIQRGFSNITPNPKKSNVFQSRRRNQSFSNEEVMLPVTFKSSQVKRDSINIIKKRDKEFKNQLPLKYTNPGPINQQLLHVEEEELNQMRETSFVINPNEEHLHQESPLPRQFQNNSNFYPTQGSPGLSVELSKVPPNTLKNFKLKAGNLSVHSCFIFLKELNIQQRYRKMFQVGNWEYSIRNSQYYLHKFYINQTLMAISLCCALPEGGIAIKYWGPTTECDNQMSEFLFKKYLEHIEKQTICKAIFYNAGQLTEVFRSGFEQQKQRIFKRPRVLPIQVQSFSYHPFLSIDFNCIAIPRSTAKNIQENITISSNVYSNFNQKQFFCFNYLLIVNKLINPGQLSEVGKYFSNLKNMKEVQTQMIKQQFFFNPYNLQSSVTPINLLTLKMKNLIISAFFIASKPFIKLSGQEIYCDKESLVVSLKFMKYNTVLYFGKGFRSMGEMMTVIKNTPGTYKHIQYCVRMFGKRLRGRINSINLRDEACFGDLQVIFEWKDFLKGKIEHNLEEYETFGDKQSFYCLLEIDKENIFVFEVNQSNFI